MTDDLFADHVLPPRPPEVIAPGALWLPGFARPAADALLAGIAAVTAAAPLRHLQTPGGHTMSVAMSNCGALGWVSDARLGYRYSPVDPASGRPWPALPADFLALARDAAAAAGYPDFHPDACLINRYAVGARMSLHRDADEQDFRQPIVSVSLGLPAVFQFGGRTRGDAVRKLPLAHGDVVVWGGPSRRHYHGVLAVKAGQHPATGACRYNLTFRKAC